MSDIESKADDIQVKFELYVVSLTFTFLAFSVQTATLGKHPYGDVFELLGWLILIISGITGIVRLYHIPIALRYYAAKEKQKDIDEEHLAKVESRISSQTYLWLFIAGFILVILARSTPSLIQAITFICKKI